MAGYDNILGEWTWDRVNFARTFRITTPAPIGFLPDAMQEKLYSNVVQATATLPKSSLDWCEENCAEPFFIVGSDRIMFCAETDLILFLAAQ